MPISETGKHKKGFTLIEVLISVVVLTTCYLVVVQGLLTVQDLSRSAAVICEKVLRTEKYKNDIINDPIYQKTGFLVEDPPLSGVALSHEKNIELDFLEKHVVSSLGNEEEKTGEIFFYYLPREAVKTIREKQK